MDEPLHSLPSEQALLSVIIRDPKCIDYLSVDLTPEDFWNHHHRVLWQAIQELIEAGRPWDFVTLAEHLSRNGKIEDAGGMPYLSQVLNVCCSAANLSHHAITLRDYAIKRGLVEAGNRQVADVHHPDGRSGMQMLEAAQQILSTLAERGVVGSGFITSREASQKAIDRIAELHNRGGGMVGIATGWTDLDRKVLGLEAGSLVIIAARPSMGKTTMAMQLAQRVAKSQPVAVFSLEMSAESLATRMLASQARVNHDRLRSATLEDEEWQRLTPATHTVAHLNLHIDDQAGLSAGEIVARSKRLHREHKGLGLIVIDYLGLIATPAKVESQNLAISKITAAMKGLAKTLNVPVVMLSQLNRNLESRPDKRPVMADLRDSGSIEQDADLILFIYRDEVYRPDSQDAGTAEILIAKHRNGQTGKVRLAFNGQFTRFDNLAHDWERPMPYKRSSKSYEY